MITGLDSFLILVLKISIVFGLVLLNGFFVAAEFALVKVRSTQLESLVKKGHRRARIAQQVTANLDASLSATQLGITLASLGLGWFAEPLFASLVDPVFNWIGIHAYELRHMIAFAVGFSVITFLHIVAGELAPKSLAIQKPLPTSLWVSYPLNLFYRISYPFIWILNNTANWLLRQCGLEPASEAEFVHTEEELRLLITSTHQHVGGTKLGRDIVLNALELRRRKVRDVMRPRNEIEFLSTNRPIQECLDLAEQTRYSRFPVCQNGDLDKTLGVVHYKDLIAMRHIATTGAELLKVSHKLIYVPETARLEKLLQRFLQQKLHIAIVVDEYGGTVGMVTMENILEELVGQIQDEFDQENPLIIRKDASHWELRGNLPLHELGELIGEEVQEEGITTTSGWITHRLGGFPQQGDRVQINDRYELRVEEMDGMLVARLTLTKKK